MLIFSFLYEKKIFITNFVFTFFISPNSSEIISRIRSHSCQPIALSTFFGSTQACYDKTKHDVHNRRCHHYIVIYVYNGVH